MIPNTAAGTSKVAEEAHELTLGEIPSEATVLAFIHEEKLCFGELTSGANTTEDGGDDGESPVTVSQLEPPPGTAWQNDGSKSYKEQWAVQRRTLPMEVDRASVLVGLEAPRWMTMKSWLASGRTGRPPWLLSVAVQQRAEVMLEQSQAAM